MAIKDQALDLESSSSQYTYVDDTASLSITGDLTIEAWVKLESQPANGYGYSIISKQGESGNYSYSFGYVNVSGTYLSLFISKTGTAVDGSYDFLKKKVTISSDVWTHIAVSWDASEKTATFYINGSSIGTAIGTNCTEIFNASSPFQIGCNNNKTSDYFDGLIEDVRIWNDIRTAQEILDNYNTELIGNETGLQGYWKFNGGYLDETTNNNDLTAVGSPIFSVGFTILDGVKLGDSILVGKLFILSLIDGLKLGDVISTIKIKISTILDGLKLGDVFSSVDDFISRWTNRTKPTTTFTNRTKPSTTFTDRAKPTTTWTKIDRG